MKKWKALRDNFMKEQRLLKKTESGVPAAKKKKYVYFDQLLFLLPYVKGNDKTTSNIPPPEEDIANSCDQADTDQGDQIREPDSENDSVRNKKVSSRKEEVKGRRRGDNIFQETSRVLTSIMAESVQLQREEKNSDKYGNKGFMLSFVPIMDSLPQQLQIHTRMKITEVFNAISYSMASGNPSPCPSTFTCSTPSPVPSEYMPQSLQSGTLATCEMDTNSGEEFSISKLLSL